MARTANRAACSAPSEILQKKIKEFASPPLEEDTASAPAAPIDEPSARPRAARKTRCQPTVWLTAVSVMSEGDQRRFELLLDALVERRVARHLQEGKS